MKNRTSKNTVKGSKTTYIPVSNNIYNNGTSYRVRVSINGKTVSVNTTSKKEAYRVRKQLIEMRGSN